MPFIVNPFSGTDPIAKAISDLGTSIYGNTGEADLRRQQILAAQRANVETTNLGKAIAADPGGAQHVLSTPVGQAMIAASGYDPKNFAALGLGGAASAYGATDPRTQNAQVGSGESYDSTAGAFQAKQAETAREFNQKPVDAINIASGQPAFAPQGNTAGFRPPESDTNFKGRELGANFNNGGLDSLSDTQQRALGVAPKAPASTPRNYVNPDGTTSITYDGKYDVNAKPLTPGGFIANAQGAAKDVGLGTNTLKTNLETSVVNNTNFVTQAGALVDLAKNHPEAFGPVGTLRGLGQEAMQTGSTLLNLVGGDQAFQQAKAAADGAGLSKVLPQMYDPNIPKARAAYYVLLYNYASALTGQSGRSVSDKDIELAQRALGDPDDLFGSAQNFITKVQTAQALAQHNADHSRFILKNGFGATDPSDASYSNALDNVGADQKGISNTAAPVTATPAPAAPAAGGQPAAAAPTTKTLNGTVYTRQPDGSWTY